MEREYAGLYLLAQRLRMAVSTTSGEMYFGKNRSRINSANHEKFWAVKVHQRIE